MGETGSGKKNLILAAMILAVSMTFIDLPAPPDLPSRLRVAGSRGEGLTPPRSSARLRH